MTNPGPTKRRHHVSPPEQVPDRPDQIPLVEPAEEPFREPVRTTSS